MESDTNFLITLIYFFVWNTLITEKTCFESQKPLYPHGYHFPAIFILLYTNEYIISQVFRIKNDDYYKDYVHIFFLFAKFAYNSSVHDLFFV